MSELIKALADVKDPLTLLAFLALVALAAFRTKQVPELFFGLMKEKLTRDRFSHLLHRVMLYGLIAFITLCIVAVLGQFFARKIQAKPFDVSALKDELKKIDIDEASKQGIVSAYDKALNLRDQDNLGDAINALKGAVEQVPTLTASYTLALLYKQKEDPDDAKKYAQEANNIAHRRGDFLDVAKTDSLLSAITDPPPPPPTSEPCDKFLVGAKEELPLGGNTVEQAVPISLGLRYVSQQNFKPGNTDYFRVPLRRGQTLIIHFRGAHEGCCGWSAAIYDVNGGYCAGDGAEADREGHTKWTAAKDGDHYVNLWGAGPGAVYILCVK
ncbi:MAG TPA: hypothetical protein VI756_02930 [Blastocatellia bacterium]